MKASVALGHNTSLGKPPAVVLINPKYSRNVGQIIRASSCFGIKQVWFTGNRVSLDGDRDRAKLKLKKRRLPREERMKGYNSVDLIHHDYPFDQFEDATPVAIEVMDSAELLPQFEHPENAIYVFGPEDGGLRGVTLRHCHRFVVIPTKHCTNLAAAVYVTLYDRMVKRQAEGLEEVRSAKNILDEERGFLGDVVV